MRIKYKLRYEYENIIYTFRCKKEFFDKMMMGLEFAPFGEEAHVYFTIHYARYDYKTNTYWMEVTLVKDDKISDDITNELLKNKWSIKN